MKKRNWKIMFCMLFVCIIVAFTAVPKVKAAEPGPNVIQYIPEEDVDPKLPLETQKSKAHEIHWLSGITPPIMPNEITVIPGRTEASAGRFSLLEDKTLATCYRYYVSPYIPGNGWYDINKYISENAGHYTRDSNLCFAVAMANVMHWWIDQNRDYIDVYLDNLPQDSELKAQILSYADNLDSNGQKKLVLQDASTSRLYNEMVYKPYKDGPGGYPDKPADYFFNGYKPTRDQERNRPDQFPAHGSNNGGLFYDVFGKSILTDSIPGGHYDDLNRELKDDMDRGVGLVLAMSYFGNGNHAMTAWGAEYDEAGNLCAIYLTDNNDNGISSGTPLPDQDDKLGAMIRYNVFKDPQGPATHLSTAVDGSGNNIINNRFPLTLARDGWKYWEANGNPMYEDGRAFMHPIRDLIRCDHEYEYKASQNQIIRTCSKCGAQDWVAISIRYDGDIYTGKTLSPCVCRHSGGTILPFQPSRITYDPGERVHAGTIITARMHYTVGGKTLEAVLKVPIRPRPMDKPNIQPELLYCSAAAVKLKTQNGYEYSCSARPDDWRSDGRFTGLQPDTDYIFQVRTGAIDSDHAPSEPSDKTLTVHTGSTEKKQLTISGVSISGKTYDGQPMKSAGIPSAVIAGTAEPAVPKAGYCISWQTNHGKVLSQAPTNAGSYQLVIRVNENDKQFYGESIYPFEIHKATVKVTAADQMIKEGDSLPCPQQGKDYFVAGLVGNDQLKESVQFKYLDRILHTPVMPATAKAGAYDIVPFGACVPDEVNYSKEIQYENGTLKINQPDPPIVDPTPDIPSVPPIPPVIPTPSLPEGDIVVSTPNKDTANISKEIIDQLLSKAEGTEIFGLKVETKNGTITYDRKAVEVIAGEAKNAEAISVTIENITENMAPQSCALTRISSDRDVNVFRISLTVTDRNGNQKEIRDFNGGKVTVTIPYQSPDSAKVTVWCLGNNGEKTIVESSYNTVDRKVTFTAPKHACYVISSDRTSEGWNEDSTGWFYIENGERITAQWRKDSQGWCYLGKNGYLLKNGWAEDSRGWCYVDAAGHQLMNGWAKDSVDWCYVNSGYMITDQWQTDSYGWLYVGADGRIIRSRWAKDSKDWCYLNSDGYLLKNGWAKDSHGWCYVGNDGRLARDCYAYDSTGKHYLNKNGHMVW